MAYDITAEVEAESDEHLFFFAWTNDVFTNPAGNGNVDNREDALNYNDEDPGGLPLGLSTGLDHIIGSKVRDISGNSKTSTRVEIGDIILFDGETDLDITFNINIQ